MVSHSGEEYCVFQAHPVLPAERLVYPAQHRDYTEASYRANLIEHGAHYVIHLPPKKRLVDANRRLLLTALNKLNKMEDTTHGTGPVIGQKLSVDVSSGRYLESEVDPDNNVIKVKVSLKSRFLKPQYAGATSQPEHDRALSAKMKLAMSKMEVQFTKADEKVRKAILAELASYPGTQIEVYRWRAHH